MWIDAYLTQGLLEMVSFTVKIRMCSKKQHRLQATYV